LLSVILSYSVISSSSSSRLWSVILYSASLQNKRLSSSEFPHPLHSLVTDCFRSFHGGITSLVPGQPRSDLYEHSGAGTGISNFPFPCHSTIVPYSYFIHLPSMLHYVTHCERPEIKHSCPFTSRQPAVSDVRRTREVFNFQSVLLYRAWKFELWLFISFLNTETSLDSTLSFF